LPNEITVGVRGYFTVQCLVNTKAGVDGYTMVKEASISIDLKFPARFISLASLRDLIHSIKDKFPIRYTEALNYITSNKIITSRSNEAIKKSTFYHYWSAALILGFIHQMDVGKSYKLSELGYKLVTQSNPGSQSLNEAEKRLAREGMLLSQGIWNNFLVFFTGNLTPSLNPAIGKYVSYKPESYNTKTNTRIYSIYSSALDVHWSTEDSRFYQMAIAGLRRWGQQCSLIDEIFPPITMSKTFGNTSFMYLIDTEKQNMTPEEFHRILLKYRVYGKPLIGGMITFDIPELLSSICLYEGLELHHTRSLLIKWINAHPQMALLDRPSVGLVEAQQGTRNKERIADSQPWLYNDGYTYTRLITNQRVFDL